MNVIEQKFEQKQLAMAKYLSFAEQIKYAISEDWDDAARSKHLKYPDVVEALAHAVPLKIKAVEAAATTGNNPALFYATQAAGVVLPPATTPIITALANLGAPQFRPNTRVLTQSALLTASEVAEGDAVPAAAPDVEFALTSLRKAGLIVVFNSELVAADNFDDKVGQYVAGQLSYAANNCTDLAVVSTLDGGNAAATVAAGMAGFAGDLRTACWIASPETLAGLQDAANPNLGPRGGFYKTLPAVPTLAAAPGKLYLVDVAKFAVYDGPQFVERTEQASIVLDTTPDAASGGNVHLFQENRVALKVLKYFDCFAVAKPTVITLA